MSKQTSIIFKSGVLISIFISVKTEYVLQRDSILNKGVWVKTEGDKFDKPGFGAGDFIFKPNSLNVDDLFQNDFYSFGGNDVHDTPFIPNYGDRAKRSSNLLENGLRKSVNDCNNKDCDPKNTADKKPTIEPKFTKPLNNPSVFSVNAYNLGVLLGKVKNNDKDMLDEGMNKSVESNKIDQNVSNQTTQSNKTFEVIMANEILVDNIDNNSGITTLPKRSMNKDYESEVIKKIEIIEGLNESKKYDRNIFDDKVRNWPGNVPPADVNIYKVIPKSEEHTSVSEKGMLKLLSILTKTFKKIMRQHLEIKKIHNDVFAGKEDIDKSVSLLINKFNDFESKYRDLRDYHEKIQQIQKKLEAKEEFFKNKETEMTQSLADFENQQKKFLTQQRQFYNIQKLMLAQNEKINAKQIMISKTQSEISRRQNNFARILKKAKQIYEVKQEINPKSQSKIANTSETDVKTSTTTTTEKPIITESVKIDLFSIPSMDSVRLLNQDQMILKEKDEHPVDDLVYKYYFNNTFIDTFMKNQILSGTLHGNKFMTRNAKVKRNEGKKVKSTHLIPVDNNALDAKVTESNGNKNSRAKRWIRHHSKGKLRRRHHKMTPEYEMKDEKKSHPNLNANLIKNTEKPPPTTTTVTNKNVPQTAQANNIKPLIALDKLAKSVERHLNPFTTMAANFCNQIGQNGNPQMLSWCIEKVLRKLQNIETIPVIATLQKTAPKVPNKPKDTAQTPKTSPPFTSAKLSVTTPSPMPSQMGARSSTVAPKATVTSETSSSTAAVYFPDNDELESNLKQYELKPDVEGNVYFDGSLHASEILGKGDSEGFSDIMPGFDSNSRIAMDPLTFDLRSMRRTSVRRMNENIMKRQKGIV